MNNKFYNYKEMGLTQGLLAKYMNCREETKLFLQGYSYKGAQSKALTYGTIVHSILEKVYVDISKGKIKSPITSVALEGYGKIVKRDWSNENRNANNGARQLFETSLVIALSILPHYFRKWWRDDTARIKWVQLEQEFRIPYKIKDGRSTLLRGKLDGVFNNPRLWLFESKTASMINEGNLVDTVGFNLQVSFYLQALQYLYKKTPSGVLYNIIRKPLSDIKSGERLESYGKRISADIASRPDFYFIRFEVMVTPAEQASFKVQLEAIITDFMNWCEGKGFHYQNTAQCITKYGRCTYLPICSSKEFTMFEKRKTVFRELESK